MTQNTQTPVQGAARQSQRAPMLRPPRRFSDRVKARSQQSAFERVAAPLVVVAGLLFGVLATLWITGLSLNDPSDEQSEASAPPALLSGSTGSTERVVTSSLGEGSVRSSAGTNDEALKPPMERFGVMPPVFGDRAVLALIVEGLGHDAALDKRLLALKLPLTVAISSDVTGAGRLAAKARSAGYEVLLQVPFEPLTG
ncbi:MAG: divergent polysaccharide deacetylase family protein, partial [Pseudomonadota bacterium]